MAGAFSRIVTGTLVSGTLDIAAAIGLTLHFGRNVDDMLRRVASGPFPEAKQWGVSGAALGLGVHFALMAIMVAVYVLAADRLPKVKRNPVLFGTLYGIATYAVMNLLVVPLRFGTGLPPSALSFLTQLFCHIFLLGLPVAFIARGRGAA